MLRQRIISAFFMLVIFLGVNFLASDSLFAVAMCLLAGTAGWEWSRLAGVTAVFLQILYGFFCALVCLLVLVYPPGLAGAKVMSLIALVFWLSVPLLFVVKPERRLRYNQELLLVTGVALITFCVFFSNWLHSAASGGSPWLYLYAMCTVWVMDVGAYFSGKRFGKTKLAPIISPGKTWEGVVGGLVLAFVFAAVVLMIAEFTNSHTLAFVLGTMLAAATSIVGDLYESRLKRASGYKDSSQLIPGHGGILDRIDGVIAAIPVFACAWIWL